MSFSKFCKWIFLFIPLVVLFSYQFAVVQDSVDEDETKVEYSDEESVSSLSGNDYPVQSLDILGYQDLFTLSPQDEARMGNSSNIIITSGDLEHRGFIYNKDLRNFGGSFCNAAKRDFATSLERDEFLFHSISWVDNVPCFSGANFYYGQSGTSYFPLVSPYKTNSKAGVTLFSLSYPYKESVNHQKLSHFLPTYCFESLGEGDVTTACLMDSSAFFVDTSWLKSSAKYLIIYGAGKAITYTSTAAIEGAAEKLSSLAANYQQQQKALELDVNHLDSAVSQVDFLKSQADSYYQTDIHNKHVTEQDLGKIARLSEAQKNMDPRLRNDGSENNPLSAVTSFINDPGGRRHNQNVDEILRLQSKIRNEKVIDDRRVSANKKLIDNINSVRKEGGLNPIKIDICDDPLQISSFARESLFSTQNELKQSLQARKQISQKKLEVLQKGYVNRGKGKLLNLAKTATDGLTGARSRFTSLYTGFNRTISVVGAYGIYGFAKSARKGVTYLNKARKSYLYNTPYVLLSVKRSGEIDASSFDNRVGACVETLSPDFKGISKEVFEGCTVSGVTCVRDSIIVLSVSGKIDSSSGLKSGVCPLLLGTIDVDSNLVSYIPILFNFGDSLKNELPSSSGRFSGYTTNLFVLAGKIFFSISFQLDDQSFFSTLGAIEIPYDINSVCRFSLCASQDSLAYQKPSYQLGDLHFDCSSQPLSRYFVLLGKNRIVSMQPFTKDTLWVQSQRFTFIVRASSRTRRVSFEVINKIDVLSVLPDNFEHFKVVNAAMFCDRSVLIMVGKDKGEFRYDYIACRGLDRMYLTGVKVAGNEAREEEILFFPLNRGDELGVLNKVTDFSNPKYGDLASRLDRYTEFKLNDISFYFTDVNSLLRRVNAIVPLPKGSKEAMAVLKKRRGRQIRKLRFTQRALGSFTKEKLDKYNPVIRSVLLPYANVITHTNILIQDLCFEGGNFWFFRRFAPKVVDDYTQNKIIWMAHQERKYRYVREELESSCYKSNLKALKGVEGDEERRLVVQPIVNSVVPEDNLVLEDQESADLTIKLSIAGFVGTILMVSAMVAYVYTTVKAIHKKSKVLVDRFLPKSDSHGKVLEQSSLSNSKLARVTQEVRNIVEQGSSYVGWWVYPIMFLVLFLFLVLLGLFLHKVW